MWSTEEHEESVYNLFISEVRNFRMRVEAHEEQLIRQIRSPLERDDPKAITQRIIDQEVHLFIRVNVIARDHATVSIHQSLKTNRLPSVPFYTLRGRRQS